MDEKLYQAGLETRREVVGADYVARSLEKNPFTDEFQKMVTEYAWGAVWTRPGLSRKTRSMLNLAMLTALNRPHELRLHLRGALTNGVTKEEIAEIFLQTLIYCGAPAANDSFKIAKEVFREIEQGTAAG